MNRPRQTIGRIALGLSCGVTALLAVPAIASASYGFDIVNRTGSTMKLTSITGSQAPFEVIDHIERRPAIGTLLAPDGHPLDVELVNDPRDVTATLTFTDQAGNTWTATLNNGYDYDNRARCAHSEPHGECDVANSSHPTIRFLDPPGTQRTVTGDDAQKQMNLLTDLCKDKSIGQCSFESRDAEPVAGYAPTQVVGQPVLNCGDTPVDDSYAWTETQESSNSLGTKFGGSIEWNAIVAKITFSLTYSASYEWGHSKTFEQDVDISDVPAGHIAYMTLTAPVTRQYGTFVAQVNNTTWTLKDVLFESPTRQPSGVPTPSKIEDRPASDKEMEACKGTTGLVRLPPSAVQQLSGNAASNTLYSPNSGGKVRGKGDDDILIGGNGADRLSGGTGDDNIIGGPGRDTLRGGPGSDTLQDTQGATTVFTGGAEHGLDTAYVRDGHGDDIVHCTTRKSAVVADRGDRVTGPCASVTRSGPIDRPPL
jgi:hypothetical protein